MGNNRTTPTATYIVACLEAILGAVEENQQPALDAVQVQQLLV